MRNRIKKKIAVFVSLITVSAMLSGCSIPLQGIGDLYEIYQTVEYYNQHEVSEPDFEREEPEDSMDEFDFDEKDNEEFGESITENTGAKGEKDAETIMIYIVGSNLESEYGNATIDMEEMMNSGADTIHNNIVVYTGGAADWQMDGVSAYKNCTLLLNEDSEFEVIDSTEAKNMGEAETLSSFINYCYDKFDSEHYSLILWNHGAGPVYGFGLDENFEDILTVEEMQQAFEDSVEEHNRRLEWIGFDACLMNSLEIADLLSPYANYMIASQETEPGWGWNYGFLSETSENAIDGARMGKAIIDYYMLYGEAVFEYYPRMYCDLTLSCIDLNKFAEVEEALDKCFYEMNDELTVSTYPELVRKRENTRDFGTYASDFDYGMVDAVHLLGQIATDTESADELVEAIKDMVVYSKSNMPNANGISICYPYSSGEDYAEDCLAAQQEIDFSAGYVNFLQKFYSIQNGEPITGNWDFSRAESSVVTVEAGETGETGEEVTVDTSDISLQLTQEQQSNFASADFFILCNTVGAGFIEADEKPRAEDMYMFIHLGRNVSLDENGVLHGYYGNQVLYIYDETDKNYSPIPLILMEEKEQVENEIRYSCSAVLNNWNIADIDDWESESVTMQIVVSEEYPNGIIRSAVPLAEEGEVNPSKQLLDLEDFGIMEIISRGSYFTRGENGEMINFFDWEHSGIIFGISQDITHDYRLEMCPLEDPENYYCIFRIKDVQGNISYSEMIPLK